MDCLICLKVHFTIDQINVQKFSSTFCKLLDLTGCPGLGTEIFNSTTTICPECIQKLQKVQQLFETLDSIVVELGEFKRQFFEDLIKSEKLSQHAGSQVEERTRIVQEITKICRLNSVSIPQIKSENTEEPNPAIFQDFFEPFDNLEDLDDPSPSDIRFYAPVNINDARLILEPLPDLKGQSCSVKKEPIASFIKRDTDRIRLKNPLSENSIPNRINKERLNLKRKYSKKSINEFNGGVSLKSKKRSRRPFTKTKSPLSKPNEMNVLKIKKVIKQKNTVSKHIRKAGRKRHLCSETPFICEVEGCGKGFRGRQSLQVHQVIHGIGPRAVQCTICGKYLQRFLLQQHLDSHEGLKKHLCEMCPKGFTQITQLNYHRMSVHLGHIFQCKECPMSYNHPSKLREHVLKEHKNLSKSIPCKEDGCDKFFITKAKMSDHYRRTHSRDKIPMPCNFCGKLLSKGQGLKEHIMKMHNNELPFKCTFTGCKSRGFVSNCRLKRHMKLHSGEQNYICEYCSKAYAAKSSLDSHLKHFCKMKPSSTELKLY